MLTRILTSAVGVVVFFAALFAPPVVFKAAIFAVIAIMLGEIYSVLRCGRLVNVIGFLSAATAAAAMSIDMVGINTTAASVPIVMMYLAVAILKHGKNKSSDILTHGFVTLYITVFMCYIIKIFVRFSPLAVLWVFVIAWITDSGAYFAGVFFGKHKLVPHISPKKTVEGAIGGVLAAVVAGVVYYIIRAGASFDVRYMTAFAAMSLVGSALSQLGDFVASCIKRDFDVKDYGSILPGHGGLMDRFDSVVFIAPFVYYSIILINSALAI